MLHKHYLKHSCYLGFNFSLQNVGFLKLIDSDLNLCLHQVFSAHTTVGMKKKKVSTWDSSFKSISLFPKKKKILYFMKDLCVLQSLIIDDGRADGNRESLFNPGLVYDCIGEIFSVLVIASYVATILLYCKVSWLPFVSVTYYLSISSSF